LLGGIDEWVKAGHALDRGDGVMSEDVAVLAP
jgi:hypothetical protein